ncbi:hypothetical protein PV325_011292 [Microctonus aethiopoides]|nr:hypothetical protein PV325_011292 [Microctonus aethiopoides]KAK0092623.1 hypothetical protein PV326_001011 [Microctonus aethiopoides]
MSIDHATQQHENDKMKKKMLAQIKADTARRLEGKRPKELMSSSSLSGMSQISNSSEETLEPLAQKSDNNESTPKETNTNDNEWLVNGSTGSKLSVLRFKCSALATPPDDPPAKQLHMTYKIIQADTKLMSLLLQSHGFTEVSDNK